MRHYFCRVGISGYMYAVLFLLLESTLRPAAALSPEQRSQRALALVQEGQVAEAIQTIGTLEAATPLPSGVGRLLFLRATLAQRLGDSDAAMQDFERVLRTYPPLADYAAWELAQYFAAQDRLEALQEVVDRLASQYPFSRLLPEAHFLLAKTLRRLDRPALAREGLERFLAAYPTHQGVPEALSLLAELYEENGETRLAAQTWQRLGESFPRHALAPGAFRRGRQLEAQLPVAQRPTPDAERLLDSIEPLMRAQRWPEVELRLATLATFEQPPALVHQVLMKRAVVALRRQRLSEARTLLLTLLRQHPDSEHLAEARYRLAEVYQRQGEQTKSEQQYAQVLERHPRSPWAAAALLRLARLLEDRQHLTRASELYERLAASFPEHEEAEESLWQAGWWRYRLGHLTAAERLWHEFEHRFPHSALLPRILYWQARAALRRGHQQSAEGLFRRLLQDYPFDYYAMQAQAALQDLDLPTRVPTAAGWQSSTWEAPSPPVTVPDTYPPEPSQPQFHLFRIRELGQLQMYEQVARELQTLGTLLPETPATQYFLASLFVDIQYYLDAFRLLNRLVGSLRPAAVRDLPHQFWTMLYPRPFWDIVQPQAEALDLDPYLVLSLIRQESAFNPLAVSSAGARGLMQLMPATAQYVARRLDMDKPTSTRLHDPQRNIVLGTHYLAARLSDYEGNRILALAAYNAGPGRVARWRQQWPEAPMDEFVERIPFNETRSYVKLVLRNLLFYERLYKTLPHS